MLIPLLLFLKALGFVSHSSVRIGDRAASAARRQQDDWLMSTLHNQESIKSHRDIIQGENLVVMDTDSLIRAAATCGASANSDILVQS